MRRGLGSDSLDLQTVRMELITFYNFCVVRLSSDVYLYENDKVHTSLHGDITMCNFSHVY